MSDNLKYTAALAAAGVAGAIIYPPCLAVMAKAFTIPVYTKFTCTVGFAVGAAVYHKGGLDDDDFDLIHHNMNSVPDYKYTYYHDPTRAGWYRIERRIRSKYD